MNTAIVIGGGHNGLVAAFHLAKAGVQTTVLEARADVGGGALTSEIHPGFRCPTLTHEVLLQRTVVRDMELAKHGLELLESPVHTASLSAAGPLVLHDDVRQSQENIRAFSHRDAAAYPDFQTALERTASVLASAFEYLPPPIDKPGAADLWNLLHTARAFRALGARDGRRLLRWGPMPVADLVQEWFESDLLRATVAAPALTGTMLGPRSAGSSLVLLLRRAHRQLAGGALRVRGGPGAATRALAAAARAAGAEIRTSTPVDQIVVRNNEARAVIAANQKLEADVVISSADPKTTLLRLVAPSNLSPDFALKMQNYRAAGTVAKVNLAVAALPQFACPPDALTGRIQIGPDLDYLERAFDHAKYGEFSEQPWLELTIPSLLDDTLAPAGAHVVSIYVLYAPYALRATDWNAAGERLLDVTLQVLERHAPGIRSSILAAHVITPQDLERNYGFAGGHIFHGELALDQLFTIRPLLGFARYATPIRRLYLCGAGTHPGGFMTGGSGRLAARAVLSATEI
jgi:phytoene dehydrogenase-like protein